MQIITFHGDVETTSYFLTQIEKQLRKDGYEVCPFYFDVEKKTVEGGEKIKPGAYFLTFNFAGLYGEDSRFPLGSRMDSVGWVGVSRPGRSRHSFTV